MRGGIRRFTIQECACGLPRGYDGHFESKSGPYAAALKAIAAIYRKSHTQKKTVEFVLRETTQGSDHQLYMYKGAKITLAKKDQVARMVKGQPLLDKNGAPVVIKHKYTVKSMKPLQ